MGEVSGNACLLDRDVIQREQGILVCPACAGGLVAGVGVPTIRCTRCLREFSIDQGIPLMFWEAEGDRRGAVTTAVKSFYERFPFPNYDDMDDPHRLAQKARKGIFARLLDDQIPFGAKILEVGCGTGQLSNFLGLSYGRTVFGADMCLNSLRLGQGFKMRHRIENTAFIQMNLFHPVFKPGSFDLVVCNGVLHHTSDPLGGWRSIAGLVKPGGFIIVGLYNRWGRLPTDFRRLVFAMTSPAMGFLDPWMRRRDVGRLKKKVWFMDQYRNPHESKHSVREVLHWFDRSGFDFVNAIPKLGLSETFSDRERLFEPSPRGGSLDCLLVQLAILASGGKEGGFFMMIGRRQAKTGRTYFP